MTLISQTIKMNVSDQWLMNESKNIINHGMKISSFFAFFARHKICNFATPRLLTENYEETNKTQN